MAYTYPYNDAIFTRTNIAIADYNGIYPETVDVYNDSAICVTFTISGPVDLIFYSYGGFTALFLDGVDQAFQVPTAVDAATTRRDTMYSVLSGSHTIVLRNSGSSGAGGHNFAFAGMDASGGGGGSTERSYATII